MTDTSITKLDNIKKVEWLKTYRNPQLMGNISTVCSTVGINRQTYYNWLEEDEDFRALVAEAKSEMCDLAEETLYSRGLEKDTTALIFWLKKRHPDFKDEPANIFLPGSFTKAEEKAQAFVVEVEDGNKT